MCKKCNFCFCKLTKFTIDSNLLVTKYWDDKYLNSNYNVYFFNKDLYTCISCGIKYAKWIYSDINKVNLLNSRKIGLKKYIPFPIKKNNINNFDYCVNCKKNTFISINTPVYLRHNYIEGFGQLCDNCYL